MEGLEDEDGWVDGWIGVERWCGGWVIRGRYKGWLKGKVERWGYMYTCVEEWVDEG